MANYLIILYVKNNQDPFPGSPIPALREFKLLAERQEKKEEAERQERKEEAEHQDRKEEAERQAREKKEEADRKERLELEKMKLDAEMKLLQAKIEAGIIKNQPNGSNARSSDAGAKHPKLPNFQDGRDDLDIWLTSGQHAGEAKTSVADQRSCFKCKKTGHITRYCTAVDSTTKKAGAGVVVKTTEVNTAEVRKPADSPTMEVMDDLQSEVEGGMLKLASGKSVPVMTNCAALRDPEKTGSLGLPVLKGEIGGRDGWMDWPHGLDQEN
ncbi:hypothetical protein PoB_003236800 [Plakobranchus ocellatus]|uniref:CCHC-type domain-containing protein n=1 Tax=Plakobranchus ocellatus TaxID=259542 RepID=A0AAV4AH41_9GAST|nr:hypothetical protein PoB_003236800 [Plakobranchus ocellatus]